MFRCVVVLVDILLVCWIFVDNGVENLERKLLFFLGNVGFSGFK
jgi:hypothetical protein